jgi:hypothetical protein
MSPRHFSSIMIPLVAVASLAFAGVPNTLAYSGRVLKTNGTPEVGVVQLRFSLFSGPATTTALWTEQQTLALSSDGLYQTKLGAVTPLPDTLVSANDKLYLELQVGQGAPLSPRQELSSVTSALVAKSVQGGEVDASSLKVNGVAVLPGFSTVRGFTTGSSTLTLPAGVTRVYVKAWGGGGAAGTTHSANGVVTAGGGGGAGGYAEDIVTVSPGATLLITSGSPGGVGSCTASAGTDSSVRVGNTTLVQASGGGAGGHAPGCCPGGTTTAGQGGAATGAVAIRGETGLSGAEGGDGGKNAMSPLFGRGSDAVLTASTCSVGDPGGAGFVWLAW